jgi:hypothetical protein
MTQRSMERTLSIMCTMYGLIMQLRSLVSAGWIVRSGHQPPWCPRNRRRPRQYGTWRRPKTEEDSVPRDAQGPVLQPYICTNDHVRPHRFVFTHDELSDSPSPRIPDPTVAHLALLSKNWISSSRGLQCFVAIRTCTVDCAYMHITN